MKAIILAAGRGSRMKSLTDERPKCLIEFRGKPLLRWQMEALSGAGVNEIGVVRGYRGELLEPYGLRAFENPRWADTQMVASLACAAEWLQKDTCLVSYSDIFYSSDSVKRLMDSPAELALTYDPNWLHIWSKRFADPLVDAETFRIGADGRILEIGRKPQSLAEVQGQYMGLLKFSPAAWRALERVRAELEPRARDKLDMTSALQRLVTAGFSVTGVAIDSEWGELDSEDDLKSLS
jgi:L-glutamine-phosphate cytidylyltransferase